MSQVITVTVTCDEHRAPNCAGSYIESADQLYQLDGIGTRMYQQEWLRGYKVPKAGESGVVDICGACWALIHPEDQPTETTATDPT